MQGQDAEKPRVKALVLTLMLTSASAFAAEPCGSFFARMFGYQAPARADEVVALGVAERPELPAEFSLLLWNVEKAKNEDWHATLPNLKNDLFMLQEVSLSNQSQQTLQSIEGADWRITTSFLDKNSIRNGVATGSKATPIRSVAMRSPVFEPLAHTPKTSMITEYAIAGSKENLLVVNVHAINFVSTKRFRRHLREVFEKLEGHRGPILLAGDMNTWSPGRIRYLREKAASLGLREEKPGQDPRRLKLDRVFVRGLEVEESSVLDQIKVSDHYPLQYRFIAE